MKHKYYNANPSGNKTTDCAIRAISKAEGISWEDAFKLLSDRALELHNTMNSVTTIDSLLENLGWDFKPYSKRLSQSKFTKPHLVRMRSSKYMNHLTYVEDNIVYDTWDCRSKQCIGIFTKVK